MHYPLPLEFGRDNFDHLMRLRGWNDFEYRSVEGDPEVIGQIWDHPYPLYGSRTHPDSFFFHFGDTTFRKLLRLIFYHRQCTYDQLKQICGNEEILEQHSAYMVKKKVAVQDGIYWKVSSQYEHINDIGTTLEWYVAEWFQLDLKAPARYHVRLKGLPTGGDLDVVAFLGEKCVMIECKSSRPESISDEELHLFLQRVAYFKPTLALLLVDTDNKLDKLSEKIRKVYTESDIVGPGNSKGAQLDLGHIFIRYTKNGIDKSLQAILRVSEADDYHDRPLLTVTPQYIQKITGILPGLTKLDSLVLKLACEQAIVLGSKLINTQDILKPTAPQGLSKEDVFEALEILDKIRYIDIIREYGGEDFSFWITPRGFDTFASIFLDDYGSLIDKILNLIVIDEIKDNKSLSTKLNKSQFIINILLEVLKSRREIEISEYMGSQDSPGTTILIDKISIKTKRKYKS